MLEKFNFYGINTIVESDEVEFLNILRQNLCFFNNAGDRNLDVLDKMTLHVGYQRKKEENLSSAIKGYNKIGNNAYVLNNSYIFLHYGLIVRITLADNNVQVDARPCHSNNFKGYIRQKIINRKNDYFLLIRYLVLFPVFYILEKKRNIFLIHGSAISYNGMGILIAGLAGIGKSTAAISLTLKPDNSVKFLTDNFLLYDKEYIYPFPEYIRVHDDMLSIIGDISKLGAPDIRRYKRNHYILKSEYISSRITPNVLFIPFLADSSYIKEISKTVALDRLLLSNDHVKEFHTYHHICLVDFLTYSEESTYKKKIKILEMMLSKIAIYEVGVTRMHAPIEEWEEIINHVS